MSEDKAILKAMAKKASQVLKDHLTVKVPEAMRVAKFTLEKSKDRTLQIHFHCLPDKPPTSITNNCLSLSVTYTNKCIVPYLYIHCIWDNTEENPHDICDCCTKVGE